MQVSSLLVNEPKKMQPAKSVAFELLLDEGSKTRARIPMRVLVNAHDTTESIISSVKNFYGIYYGNGLIFEDGHGSTLIAAYDNFADKCTVYVRSVAGPPQAASHYVHPSFGAASSDEPQRRPSLGEPIQMLPPHMRETSHSPSRSASRLARKRSSSPQHGRGRRSASQQKNGSFSAASRASSANDSHRDENGYSDSEAGRSSISGSKKAKSEQFASSEISTANVLQDGRRGQPIFDSSTLPLFVPPQVPVTASQSSISPQRRSLPQEGPSPFHAPVQRLYSTLPPVLSPQSFDYSHLRGGSGHQTTPTTFTTPPAPHGHRLRDRSAIPGGNTQSSRDGFSGQGVLPTPDPTVASCISDEDVARTLIALGDASNYSHGRTSNSTIDDTFSGHADAASSTGATSDSDEYSENEGGFPKRRKYLDEADNSEYKNTIIKSEFDEYDGPAKTKKVKTKVHDGPGGLRGIKTASSSKHSKNPKVRSNTLPKLTKPGPSQQGLNKIATAPTTPNTVRKTSSTSSLSFQNQLAVDEEDLSSKPRCQRCRKSKKGCDRQRPCQRCKDAGIGIDGCVSEDEGNGRKGRFGRHMGVPVKKGDELLESPASASMLVEFIDSPDKSKKRKR